MKDYPSYKSIIYYYSSKHKTDKITLSKKLGEYCGSLIFTENNTFYFSPYHGGYLIPDSISDDGCEVPSEWFNIGAIKYAIDHQPFDNKDEWFIGHSMYSKDLFYNILADIRDFKIKIIQENPNIEWGVIH